MWLQSLFLWKHQPVEHVSSCSVLLSESVTSFLSPYSFIVYTYILFLHFIFQFSLIFSYTPHELSDCSYEILFPCCTLYQSCESMHERLKLSQFLRVDYGDYGIRAEGQRWSSPAILKSQLICSTMCPLLSTQWVAVALHTLQPAGLKETIKPSSV